MIRIYWAKREGKKYHAFTEETKTLCGQKIEDMSLFHLANELPKGSPACINCDHAARKLKREAQNKPKEKPLKLFNGRDPFHLRTSHVHAFIAANSKAEAVRIGKQAFGQSFTLGELNQYWAECWGTQAEEAFGIPTEPGAFIKIERQFFKYVGSCTTW